MPRGPYAFGWDSKLRKTDDFSSVFRFKRVQRGTCLDIFFCQNGLPYSRLGLVVPKKILPRAVDRNRARRILREVFRLSQPRLASLDVIVRVKAAGRDADFRAQWDMFVHKHATKPANAAAQQMNG
ncbi:MAG: ribonuclease P protein component [Hydrogenophilaceae bacterium]